MKVSKFLLVLMVAGFSVLSFNSYADGSREDFDGGQFFQTAEASDYYCSNIGSNSPMTYSYCKRVCTSQCLRVPEALDHYCSTLGSDQPMTLSNCKAFCYSRNYGQCIQLRPSRASAEEAL
ncbi:hypothetical protein K2X30_14605 [bacterium]|nr:hypothetical protein [bacterium]